MAKSVAPRGFARGRVLEAALALFTENGVNGTSLQMIAERLGVNKSAVYYQFRTKEDLVLGLVRPVFDDINQVIKIANALSAPESKRETAISGIVELAVRQRAVAFLLTDPAVESAIRTQAEFIGTYDNLVALLHGHGLKAAGRAAMSLLLFGVFASVGDPALADIPDDQLHSTMLECARRLLEIT